MLSISVPRHPIVDSIDASHVAPCTIEGGALSFLAPGLLSLSL